MLKLDNKQDIERLIEEGLLEGLALEYKRSLALKNVGDAKKELVKDVTALANSAGGQIIYGIEEKDQKPLSIDEGVEGLSVVSWIEDVLTSNIFPKVRNVDIKAIRISEIDDKYVYVISVPEMASDAPHQNGIDNKYYRRSGSKSVPMYDYEIKNIIHRKHAPDLYLNITIGGKKEINLEFDRRYGVSKDFIIEAKIGNYSPEPALYSVVNIYIDSRIHTVEQKDWKFNSAFALGVDMPCNVFFRKFAVPNEMPIFREASIKIFQAPLNIAFNIQDRSPIDSFLISYEIFSPGCHTRKFGKLIREVHKLRMEL